MSRSARPERLDSLKARLQSKGTKSAKRHLKKLSGRTARFSKDVNHCISKKHVAKAKDTLRSIALEDLQGIRDRVTVRKAQRRSLHAAINIAFRAEVNQPIVSEHSILQGQASPL